MRAQLLSGVWLFAIPQAVCSPPGSSVHGILQARILEWVAISSSRGSSQHRDQTCVYHVSCIAGRFFTAEPLGKSLMVLDIAIKSWSINCSFQNPGRVSFKRGPQDSVFIHSWCHFPGRKLRFSLSNLDSHFLTGVEIVKSSDRVETQL